MKKLLAVMLSLALILGLGITAGAVETGEKQVIGTLRVNGEFTIKGSLPDGYNVNIIEQSDDVLRAQILSEDPARPGMILDIAFDETYYDVDRLNDLDDEAMAILEKTFTDTDPYVNITYDETKLGTRLLMARTTSEFYDYLDILSIYKGYFVEFVMYPGQGAAEPRLTDEQIEACNAFLTELDFVPGIPEELSRNGKTFVARIEGFNAEEKTLDAALMVPVTLTQQEVKSLEAGDTLMIGPEAVEVESIVFDTDGSVTIGDYELTLGDDGLYTARLYEDLFLREAERLIVAVPENLVFTDEINAETGEIFDEPFVGGTDDLFAALDKAERVGVGFDVDNVYLTFDGEGNAAEVRRFYAPWQ